MAVIAALSLGASPPPQAAAAGGDRTTTITLLKNGQLKLTASPGTRNNILIYNLGANFIQIHDMAGLPLEAKVPMPAWWTIRGGNVFQANTYGIRGIVVFAGDQNDRVVNESRLPSGLYGGSGDDQLEAGSEEDQLLGGAGMDRLYAKGPAGDVLNGGPDNDGLYGGEGPDWLKGGTGTDVADGKGGTDECEAEHEIYCEAELRLIPRPNPIPTPDIPFTRSPD
ncbi:calcium-binding protein [Streptomyces venezuelae]|uniref:calcium-binding protein n=1 Tax=Streptomyces venezuelae TaxID=54571 RepID=UPI00332F418B